MNDSQYLINYLVAKHVLQEFIQPNLRFVTKMIIGSTRICATYVMVQRVTIAKEITGKIILVILVLSDVLSKAEEMLRL